MIEENTRQIKVSPSKQLQCASSERNLCNATQAGLKLYCRSCGYAHLFTWQEIEAIRKELTETAE